MTTSIRTVIADLHKLGMAHGVGTPVAAGRPEWRDGMVHFGPEQTDECICPKCGRRHGGNMGKAEDW